MVDRGMQSSTVKSYISAIKRILLDDGYELNYNQCIIKALTRACRIINDRVMTRLPITCGLLELILFELQRYFDVHNQWYLDVMYRALFTLGYYGLLRVGELTLSEHVVWASSIHVAANKDKLLVYLYSSKTHTTGSRPQKIWITSNQLEQSGKYVHRHFCSVEAMDQYLRIRGAICTQKGTTFCV